MSNKDNIPELNANRSTEMRIRPFRGGGGLGTLGNSWSGFGEPGGTHPAYFIRNNVIFHPPPPPFQTWPPKNQTRFQDISSLPILERQQKTRFIYLSRFPTGII